MNRELEIELRNWMRPVSPLTAFAQSLRNEGPTDAEKQAEQDKAQQIVDHFAGVDLDELPENARNAINKASELLKVQHTTLQSTEQRRVQAEQFARTKQSEADKLRGIVQKHNLLDGEGKPNLAGDKHAERVDRFVKQHGLKPEAAEVYAKLFESESGSIKQEIIAELGPLAGAVGGMQANQHLISATQAHPELFAVPEIAKSVTDNVTAMVNAGNAVNEKTIAHLLEMAVGGFHMSGKSMPSKEKAGAIPNFSGVDMSNGGLPNATSNTTNGAPKATQVETVNAMTQLQSHFRQGLPQKGKK